MQKSPDSSSLSENHRLLLEEMVGRFERAARRVAWTGREIDLRDSLPVLADPLRVPALHKLIPVDLEFRWRRKQCLLLESYLARFPELGPPEELPADLIFHEYCVRHAFGDQPAVELYQTRFPDQFPKLIALIADEPSSVQSLATLENPQRSSSANGPPAPGRLPATPSPLPPTVSPASAANVSPPARPAATPIPPTFVPGPPTPSHGGSQVWATPPPAQSGSLYVQNVGESFLQGSGYKALQKLGSGTFGEVWKAEAPGGAEVAVKIVSRPLEQAEAQQELHSLEHVKRLRHPFLVQIQAYWVHRDRLCIVMDLADGSLLDRARQCRSEGQLGIPVDELLGYLENVAEGLDYLHSEKVHHRDIKPANILLLKGYAKLADFGLARALQTDQSLVEATRGGTAPYMAPEVWQSKVSPHSDQWSLAAAYAELRMDRRPYASRDPYGLMLEICQGEPDLADLPERERQVLQRALAQNPGERYPNCVAFAKALREALAPERIQTQKHESPSKSWLSLLPGVLAGCAAALIVLGAVSLYLRPPPQLTPPDPVGLVVATGREETCTFRIQRRNFKGRIRVSCADADLPKHVQIPAQELAADEDEVKLQVVVGSEALTGKHPIDLHADLIAAAGNVVPGALVRLDLTVVFLRPGFEPQGEQILADDLDGRYYARIARRLDDGTLVPFVLIPHKKRPKGVNGKPDPPTFYMMENKVSLGLFRKWSREIPPPIADLWVTGVQTGAATPWAVALHSYRLTRDEQHPALDIRVDDAYAFAVWLTGNLPTVEQWDTAAGLYDNPPGAEGPYQGMWALVRTDIAVNRKEPMRLDEATGDVSAPYPCKNMSGNGLEWTRTLTDGSLVPANAKDRDTASVLFRAQSFQHDHPLNYQELKGTPQSGGYTKTAPTIGFRVVIEP